jgi:hypothetical protein
MQTEQLIRSLAQDLTPVRPLRAPPLRALAWLAVVAAISALIVLRFSNLTVFAERMATPRTAMDWIATGITGFAAAWAAFELSIPGASPRWALLPLPSFIVWLCASGLGCLANGLGLQATGNPLGESRHCVVFILAASVPLALALFAMLRRARPIDPVPVAALGTLGVAATAAFLLQFFHPFDVTAIDLALHLAAIAVVVLIGLPLRRLLLRPA